MNAKNKLTWSISIFLLVTAAFGCGQGKQTPGNESNDPIVERIDRVAAADFKEFVENYKNDIIKILEENNFLPANLPNPYKYISWHLYKSTNMFIKNGMGTAKIMLSGWEKSHENDYQKAITLWFERKDGKWYLIVKDGYLTSSVSMNSKAYSLPLKIHEAFTVLFPHLEYDVWHKWKDPVLRSHALIRLKSTLPHTK